MTDTLTTDAPNGATPDAEPEHDPLAPTPEAPYGRADDGVLLDRKGRRAPYGLSKSGLRKSHQGTKQRRQSAGAKAASRPSGRSITVKRRHGLTQLLEMPKGVLLGLGYRVESEAMLADAVTLDMHGGALSNAVAELCEENDRLGRVVDRLIEVGPLAQIGMVMSAFVAQVARNHGALPAPVASMLGGSADPAELAQVARGSMEQAMSDAPPVAA